MNWELGRLTAQRLGDLAPEGHGFISCGQVKVSLLDPGARPLTSAASGGLHRLPPKGLVSLVCACVSKSLTAGLTGY